MQYHTVWYNPVYPSNGLRPESLHTPPGRMGFVWYPRSMLGMRRLVWLPEPCAEACRRGAHEVILHHIGYRQQVSLLASASCILHCTLHPAAYGTYHIWYGMWYVCTYHTKHLPRRGTARVTAQERGMSIQIRFITQLSLDTTFL